jgi:hypothetical protein
MKEEKVNDQLSQEQSKVNHGSRARIDLTRALELFKSLTPPPAPPAQLIDALADAVLEVLPEEGLNP